MITKTIRQRFVNTNLESTRQCNSRNIKKEFPGRIPKPGLDTSAQHSDSSTSSLFQGVKLDEIERWKGPTSKQGLFSSLIADLLGDDVRRARAFFALSDLELDLLALVEGGVT